MDHSQHNGLISFIWGIADDVLRDIYVRGKYRDVILPMAVIRRIDVLLEPSKEAVLKMKAQLDKAKVTNQEAALRKISGYGFYNTSQFTLRRLLDNPKQLRANFLDYLDGFSANVGEIVAKFAFRNQVDKLHESDVLGQLIEKFLSPDINLSPNPVLNGDGSVKHPGLSNLGMGYAFEELIRKFNEENNEEAGEHFTPREIVLLMTCLLFLPIKDKITSGTYTVYDCACGSGGMLTESDTMVHELAAKHGKEVSIHLYGQESQPETFAICKADLLIKGEEEKNIAFGSTLSQDAFPRLQFDFMLANSPFGKSWKTDLERLCAGEKSEMRDSRFVVQHGDKSDFSLVTRSSDGQLMFLVNMLAKMKSDTPLGNQNELPEGDNGAGSESVVLDISSQPQHQRARLDRTCFAYGLRLTFNFVSRASSTSLNLNLIVRPIRRWGSRPLARQASTVRSVTWNHAAASAVVRSLCSGGISPGPTCCCGGLSPGNART